MKNLSYIVPFVIVTVVVYAMVELFYGVIMSSVLTIDRSSVNVVAVDRTPTDNSKELQKYSDYSIISSRNLFQSSAQVEAQEGETSADPYANIEATKLELVLMGTITGQDGADRAIIYKKRENKQEIFYKGDAIEGALIKRILRGRIILEYQGNDEILDMSEASSVKPRQSPVKAAVSPLPQRKQILSGPSSQVPRRRIISSGTQARRVVPQETPQDENAEPEEFFEDAEDLVPEEVIDHDIVIDQDIEPDLENNGNTQ